jgi:hypothetical protein
MAEGVRPILVAISSMGVPARTSRRRASSSSEVQSRMRDFTVSSPSARDRAIAKDGQRLGLLALVNRMVKPPII